MKKLFKKIVRRVDEKVSKTINSVNECINNIRDIMKDKDDLINFGMILLCTGLGIGSLGACMIMKSKAM